MVLELAAEKKLTWGATGEEKRQIFPSGLASLTFRNLYIWMWEDILKNEADFGLDLMMEVRSPGIILSSIPKQRVAFGYLWGK